MKNETKLWDPVDYLNCVRDITAYWEAALEDGDPDLIESVREDIMRARVKLGLPAVKDVGRGCL